MLDIHDSVIFPKKCKFTVKVPLSIIEGLSNHSSGDNMHEKKGNRVTGQSNGDTVLPEFFFLFIFHPDIKDIAVVTFVFPVIVYFIQFPLY